MPVLGLLCRSGTGYFVPGTLPWSTLGWIVLPVLQNVLDKVFLLILECISFLLFYEHLLLAEFIILTFFHGFIKVQQLFRFEKNRIVLPPSSYPSFLQINFQIYCDSKKGRRKNGVLEWGSEERNWKSKSVKLEK